MPKSLEKDISLNTAAYSKARERVPIELTKELFKASRIEQAENAYTHWNGYRVFIGDGTYLQMQDTESIRKEYEVKHNAISGQGYPQGLLEVIIERGTGQLYSFELSNRHVSELSLFYKMLVISLKSLCYYLMICITVLKLFQNAGVLALKCLSRLKDLGTMKL